MISVHAHCIGHEGEKCLFLHNVLFPMAQFRAAH